MLVKVHIVEMPVTGNSGIRFPDPESFMISESVIESVRVPEEHALMSSLSIDLEVGYDGSYCFLESTEGTTYWWIESYQPVANRSGTVRYTLARDPWPEMADRTVYGSFERLPWQTLPGVPLNIKPDVLRRGPNISLPCNGTYGLLIPLGVVQVTYTRKYTADPEKEYFTKMTCIVDVRNWNKPVHAYIARDHVYPTMYQVMNNLTNVLSVPSSAIKDVTISFMSPYQLRIQAADGRYYASIMHSGATHDPGAHGGFHYYDSVLDGTDDYVDDWVAGTMTIPGYRAGIDELDLYDGYNNLVAVIPASAVSNGKVKVATKTFPDLYGMITYISIDYDDAQTPFDGGYMYIIQHGKLPIVSSAWTDYALNERLYDRELMTISREKELANGVSNVGTGLIGGALLGSAGGAVGAIAGAAVSLLGLGAGTAVNMTAAEKEQHAKESMIQRSDGSVANLAYGMTFVYNEYIGLGARIEIKRPATTTSVDIDNYVKAQGYPATGRKDIIMRDHYGFYRGVIQYTRGPSGALYTPKHLQDIMNRELATGIQYLERKEDI